MQNLITALVFAIAVIQFPARSQPVLVKSIVDGRTIVVAPHGRVRLAGLDTPSPGAREKLASLLQNRWVHLESDAAAPGVYVMTDDGQCANVVIVREGLARVSARQPLTRLAELQRAERDAKAARRGVWGYTRQDPSTRKKTP